MTLWSENGPLASQASQPNSWRVPKFIRRDEGIESTLLHNTCEEEISILLLEDLGEVDGLRNTIRSWASAPNPDLPRLSRAVASIGHSLGTSLAVLHSQSTLEAVNADQELSSDLDRRTDDVVWYLAMSMMPTWLKDEPKGEEYIKRLTEDYRNPEPPYPPCVMHGDFNYGNVLLQKSAEFDDDIRPWLTDSEFATKNGRGVNGDISEFLSPLHCQILSTALGKPDYSAVLTKLCISFCTSYREKAQLVCKMQRDDLNTRLYRSALLLSGRDVVNFANDAMADDEQFDKMMQVGLWYLDRAGSNMDEFLQASNVDELASEDGGFIRSLFLFQ